MPATTKLERDVERTNRRELTATRRAKVAERKKNLTEEQRITRMFREHANGAFKAFTESTPCKINPRERRIEFSYRGLKYWLMLSQEWREHSNAGEEDGYHLTYVIRLASPQWEHRYYVCDFYNETTKNVPHKIGCDCGCLGWGLTVPRDQYANIIRALRKDSHEVIR